MKQVIYQVDAFTDKVFSGNPAAVCPLTSWPDDELLQNIAMENNLAETAYYVKEGDRYVLRWFTPAVEVDLCGHATLASAFVLFNHGDHQGDTIHFHSPKSGALSVTRKGDMLTMNFPTDVFAPVKMSEEMMDCFDVKPRLAFKGKTDYMFVFDSEMEIRKATPFIYRLLRLDGRGVIITARGKEVDFVSRFFAPRVGINEDPVTGSAHTLLTPYWAKELGKQELTALQLSARQGSLRCKHLNDRVEISGQARLYMIGEIFVK